MVFHVAYGDTEVLRQVYKKEVRIFAQQLTIEDQGLGPRVVLSPINDVSNILMVLTLFVCVIFASRDLYSPR